MANPLSRTIMNNIVNKTGPKTNGSNNKKEYKLSKSNISKHEEDLLKEVYTKGTKSKNNKQRNKISLDELIGKKNKEVKKEKKEKDDNKKMVTLDDLSGNKKEKENKNKNKKQYVKSTKINNPKGYIPKVSLNSIGKKNTFNK